MYHFTFSRFIKRCFFLILILIPCICSAQAMADVLNNETVVTMTKAGLPKSLILAKIQNSNTNFDVSVDAMIALKNQGVDDDVLTAMATKGSTGNIISASATGVNGLSKNEVLLTKAESGIYCIDEKTGEPVELDASVFSNSKTGSGILTAVTYGIAKTKQKAILSGAQANLQLSVSSPVFYFVFPHRAPGELGTQSNENIGFYNNASSPNEFMLVKFKVSGKERQIVTGSFNSYVGFSGGIDDQNKVPYRSKKISPGLYKVYFEAPISSGEYAFVFAGTAANAKGEVPTQKAYDFSLSNSIKSSDDQTDMRSGKPAPPDPLHLFKKKSQDTTKSTGK
jgi:hypothetical protein